MEDCDPHPEDDQHRGVGVHGDYHGICGVVVDGGGGDLLAMSMFTSVRLYGEHLQRNTLINSGVLLVIIGTCPPSEGNKGKPFYCL